METKLNQIDVCGRLWSIEFMSALSDSDNCGETDLEQQKIRINKNMHPDVQAETLVHEILHICLNFSGLQDGATLTEEELVSRIAPTLTIILQTNSDISNRIYKLNKV